MILKWFNRKLSDLISSLCKCVYWIWAMIKRSGRNTKLLVCIANSKRWQWSCCCNSCFMFLHVLSPVRNASESISERVASIGAMHREHNDTIHLIGLNWIVFSYQMSQLNLIRKRKRPAPQMPCILSGEKHWPFFDWSVATWILGNV